VSTRNGQPAEPDGVTEFRTPDLRAQLVAIDRPLAVPNGGSVRARLAGCASGLAAVVQRTAAVVRQARSRLAGFAGDVQISPAAAVRARRGTTRLFFAGAASTSQARYPAGRLTGRERGPWARELTVHWPG